MIALYLNVFVGVVQAFQKVPALKALAPTQSEPPFVIAQLAVLALFVVLAIGATKEVHSGAPSTAQPDQFQRLVSCISEIDGILAEALRSLRRRSRARIPPPRMRAMRSIVRVAAVLLLFAAIPARGQWTALGEMPRPSRQGNALRFENAQAVAVVTALSPEVIRVRVTPRREGRDHSYAVINRDLGDPGATFSIEAARSVISTSALRVSIQHAPFRVAFATSAGQSLDEDDARGTAFFGTAIRVWKRLRDDEHVYALGEKNGPLDKRGWKLGGYSFTMWNSDTFGYDSSTDPLYVSVPFYIVLRKGVALRHFSRQHVPQQLRHRTSGRRRAVVRRGGGALDYYFIYGPEPKKVIERYTALTGRMPLPPLWSLGYNQCRYSYYPEKKVRFIAENFRLRRIPADVIWLDIHYQDSYKPFTWDRPRFPDPARMIGDLRKDGFRIVTIVDPHPKKEKGYAPYDSGLAGDHFVKNPDGSIYEAPVWPSQAEVGAGPSVFPDFSKPAARVVGKFVRRSAERRRRGNLERHERAGDLRRPERDDAAGRPS